jgi:hypothetical protein
LQDYLQRQNGQRVELSFPEIERIIGGELPPSAYAPRWWISHGCSTLSTEFPLEERIGSGESGGVSILTEC